MKLSQNLKTIAGASVVLTASAFMFAIYGTLARTPIPVHIVNFTAIFIGFGLMALGAKEERHKLQAPASK